MVKLGSLTEFLWYKMGKNLKMVLKLFFLE